MALPGQLAADALSAAPDTDLESLEELLCGSGAGAAEDLERAVANAQVLARFV